MATIFRARQNSNAGSGGKILRGRRVAAVTSPYARPNSPPPPPENPNWLFGVIFPATRMVANGAGRLISYVFGSDSSLSASSSEDDDTSSQGSDRLNQNGARLEADKYLVREQQTPVQRSEAKCVIEQLLMQETFSWDECNRLTKIIQSRVVECPTTQEGEDARQNELPHRTIGSANAFPGALQSHWQTRKSPASYSYLGDSYDSLSPRAPALGIYADGICNTAVMEAKKWLEEKKSESSSKLDWGHETCTSNPFMLLNVTKGEVGSPVVMAKSYMQARPPWASPSLRHNGFQTPSPIGMHLFNEKTPYAIGGHSFPSSELLKSSSPAVGSWSALDETRRVHFKSGEDILQPLSSKQHIDSSTLELEHRGNQTSSVADKRDVVDVITHDSNSLTATRSVDASVNLPAELATNGGLPVHRRPGNEALSSSPAILNSNENQDLEDARLTMREGCFASVTHESLVPDPVSVQHNGPQNRSAEIGNSEPKVKPSDDIKSALRSAADNFTGLDTNDFSQQPSFRLGEMGQKNSSDPHQFCGLNETDSIDDLRSPGGNCPTKKDANGSRDRVTANGFPSSTSSFSEGLNAESGPRPTNQGDSNPICLSDGKLATTIPMEETCELLSEASVEVPIMEEIDNVASGSQNSSSRSKELLQTQPQSNSSHGVTGKSSTRVEKQQGKRVGRYSRRGGRGRGK